MFLSTDPKQYSLVAGSWYTLESTQKKEDTQSTKERLTRKEKLSGIYV